MVSKCVNYCWSERSDINSNTCHSVSDGYFMKQVGKSEQHLVCIVSPPRIKSPAVSLRRQHLSDLHQPTTRPLFDVDVFDLWGL